MWGTSCCPYLSRPVILILPWLFGCQEEQAVKPVGESSSGRVSCARAPRGLGNSRLLTTGQSGSSGQCDMQHDQTEAEDHLILIRPHSLAQSCRFE
ncbi:hypothetical protein CesoFtcFv8_023642 [Champsocephalus esox]|uniref:Secreted protein n=1 Tax=Champsocephalus esox TaxID=159716 RepID=A0AAN8B9M6_9TELE|nr:hypothetical protein CesoFtcFv8_023642 [Champsocephalus esox]